MIVNKSDAATVGKIASDTRLSIGEVSAILRDYIVIPRNRAVVFDGQAINGLKKELADARQENAQLRKRMQEICKERDALRSALNKAERRSDARGRADKKAAPGPA